MAKDDPQDLPGNRTDTRRTAAPAQPEQPGIPGAPERSGRLGWCGGSALGLGITCFLLTLLPAFALFRLTLEIDGWTGAAVWMGPGWAAGLSLGIILLVVGARSGSPKMGAWGLLGMFLLWAAPWVLIALGQQA